MRFVAVTPNPVTSDVSRGLSPEYVAKYGRVTVLMRGVFVETENGVCILAPRSVDQSDRVGTMNFQLELLEDHRLQVTASMPNFGFLAFPPSADWSIFASDLGVNDDQPLPWLPDDVVSLSDIVAFSFMALRVGIPITSNKGIDNLERYLRQRYPHASEAELVRLGQELFDQVDDCWTYLAPLLGSDEPWSEEVQRVDSYQPVPVAFHAVEGLVESIFTVNPLSRDAYHTLLTEFSPRYFPPSYRHADIDDWFWKRQRRTWRKALSLLELSHPGQWGD